MEDIKCTYEPSAETVKLVEYLSTMKESDVVSYDSLDVLAGIDVRSTGRLESARRICQREFGIVFGVIRGQGLRMLTPAEIVNTTDDRRSRIRRSALRGVKTLKCSDSQRLTLNDQNRKTVGLMLLNEIRHKTTGDPATKISKQYKPTPGEIESMGRIR